MTADEKSIFQWPTREEGRHASVTAPLVSVAIPVYNGENFLAEAIASVLGQTLTDLELIIVDNASTDGTAAICQQYANIDPRVRYYRNERNLGAAANYNRGLELARGKYFKWLAHDDWISANYCELCADLLDHHPDVVVAFGMPREMLDPATPFLDSTFTVPLWGAAGPVARFAQAMRMDRTCHAIFGLMRRDLVERTTLHRPYYTSDRNLVAEMALLGRFAAVPEAIFYNRKHALQSMAQSANTLKLNTWQDTSNQRPYSTMHLSRLRHFWEIAGRYPEVASRRQMVRAVAGSMFSPRKLAHYGDELCAMAAPQPYQLLRAGARRLYRALRPARSYLGDAGAAGLSRQNPAVLLGARSAANNPGHPPGITQTLSRASDRAPIPAEPAGQPCERGHADHAPRNYS